MFVVDDPRVAAEREAEIVVRLVERAVGHGVGRADDETDDDRVDAVEERFERGYRLVGEVEVGESDDDEERR